MNKAKGFHLERVNSDIEKCVSNILLYKFGGVSVIRAETSEGFYDTKIYVDCDDQTFSRLKKSEGFIRHEVANSVKLKTTPRITFIKDIGQTNYSRVEELLNKIALENKNKGGADGEK